MSIYLEERLWAGSEQSMYSYVESMKAMTEKLAAGWEGDEDEREGSRLLQVQDGVGVVSIRGKLNNVGSILNELFGMTGYPEIREAMVEAASNPEIKKILLDIDSPGGTVAGLADAADLIRLVNDRVKPVEAFTEGAMGSAAYWLGASAGRVHASRMSIVGSIGVIAFHMEKSERLKREGINVKVIRSGPYKALANAYEPLSEEGEKQLQAQVDSADAVFVEHVANMRGRSIEYTKEHMAQGREFVGEDAYRVGLTDSVTRFDTLLSELKEKIDPSKNFMDNSGKVGRGYSAEASGFAIGEDEMKRKKALTEQEIAALSSGASLDAGTSADDAGEPGTKASAEQDNGQPSQETGEGQAASGEGAAPEASGNEGEGEGQAGTEELAKNDATLRYMQAQLKETRDELFAAKLEGHKSAEALAELEALIEPMSQIVAKATNNMRVALGGSALDMAAMTPKALIAEHASVSEQFTNKFKAGGVAAVDAAQPEHESEYQVDALTSARMAAVRNQKKGN